MTQKKGIIELVAVVVEFCSTLESTDKMTKKEFIERTHKLLSLLYMKTAVLSSNSEADDFCEKFVTEKDWEMIRSAVEAKLGSHDPFERLFLWATLYTSWLISSHVIILDSISCLITISPNVVLTKKRVFPSLSRCL